MKRSRKCLFERRKKPFEDDFAKNPLRRCLSPSSLRHANSCASLLSPCVPIPASGGRVFSKPYFRVFLGVFAVCLRRLLFCPGNQGGRSERTANLEINLIQEYGIPTPAWNPNPGFAGMAAKGNLRRMKKRYLFHSGPDIGLSD